MFANLQTLQARTPLKPYMAPLTRNETAKTPGTLKTPGKFKSPGNAKTPGKPKTPGKMLPPSTVKRLGASKKYPMNTSINNKFVKPTGNPPSGKRFFAESLYPAATRTSLWRQRSTSVDNNPFNNLNFSTSTEVDAPSEVTLQPDVTFVQPPELSVTLAQPSYSPLMRKIEEAMDLKFMSFMNTLKNKSSMSEWDVSRFQDTMRDAVLNDVNQSVAESIIHVEDPKMVRMVAPKSPLFVL